jgi:acetyl/propionyl-CoA carboxylase alpha subunit/acetyl-CoA carboxylase carboxyltransferase component
MSGRRYLTHLLTDRQTGRIIGVDVNVNARSFMGGRILVANRGEIAIRIMRAAAELGLQTVAVHPDDDERSLHVLRADAAYRLRGQGASAYLDIDQVIEAARATGSTLIHPGYGFLSENAELARRCDRDGLTLVGPGPRVLDLFGDKGQARRLATEHDVPVLPGTTGATTLQQVQAFAAEHGAVMLKAVAGGGGRGMRAVPAGGDIAEAFERCSSEAAQAFGIGDLYVERLLIRPRHIEVQVIGDGRGGVSHLWERDCSIQRQQQKVVEVAPSPNLAPQLRDQLLASALRLASAVGYRGLGTFEFLVLGREFWFIEANPRLQVEHTITEEITGVDLVQAQIRIALGETLADLGLSEPPEIRGASIQARLNLETLSDEGLVIPGAGTLGTFVIPSGPGVRVDTFGYPGYTTSLRYDSLLAKVIVRADDFPTAARRAYLAVSEFRVEGAPTNRALLQGVLKHPDFLRGNWNTGFIPDHLTELLQSDHRDRFFSAESKSGDRGAAIAPPEVPAGLAVVLSPLPGTVLTVDVALGDRVAVGSRVAVLEAMKMEHVVRAESAGVVRAVLVAPGDTVPPGAGVVALEPADVSAAEHAIPAGPDADRADWSAEVAEIERRRRAALAMGGRERVDRQHAAGRLTVRERVDAFADDGSFQEIGALTAFVNYSESGALVSEQPANFVAGTARVRGRKVVVGADDFTVRGASGDGAVYAKQIFLERYAGDMRLPMIRLMEGASGGGSVKMVSDAGYTYVPVLPGWDAVVDNLSLVPVVSACLGPTVGLGAARAVMSHLTIAVAGKGQVFTAGPPVVRGGTGEVLTPEQLGGADVHRHSGAVDRFVSSEREAFDVIRAFLGYLPDSVFELPPVIVNDDPVERRDEFLLSAIPRNRREAYLAAPILDAIFDEGSVFPYATFGDSTITALARLDGHPVGVLAADPAQGATMSVEGATAVTRLVDLCETFHLPLVSLTDQAGVTIGLAAERRGTIRYGARAITAVYQARVPQAEIILRRVYGVGGAGIVNRHATSRSWAWPSGDWGSLPAQGGIEAAFRAELAAASDPEAMIARIREHLAAVASPFRTAERFGVQDLIDPRDSRRLLCDWVRDAYRVLPELRGRPSFGTRP